MCIYLSVMKESKYPCIYFLFDVSFRVSYICNPKSVSFV